jgi:hypothetical protein
MSTEIDSVTKSLVVPVKPKPRRKVTSAPVPSSAPKQPLTKLLGFWSVPTAQNTDMERSAKNPASM